MGPPLERGGFSPVKKWRSTKREKIFVVAHRAQRGGNAEKICEHLVPKIRKIALEKEK